jgi:hypothetical protein
MPPKKTSTITKAKKKGGKSSFSESPPEGEDPGPSQNDSAEIRYDTAISISTSTRTSHNSSAPIVIPMKADGSYGDPRKIAREAARTAKLAREAEARAQPATNLEQVDDPPNSHEEDPARLIEAGLNMLPSDTDKEDAIALEGMSYIEAGEYPPVYECTIEDGEDNPAPSGLPPARPSSSEDSVTPTQLSSSQQLEPQRVFHRQSEDYNPFPNQTHWRSYPSRIPERIFGDFRDGPQRPELTNAESETQKLPPSDHPQSPVKRNPVLVFPPQRHATQKIPLSSSLGRRNHQGVEDTDGINREYRERTSKILNRLTKETAKLSSHLSSLDSKIDVIME